ncbi:MAG TPA: methyltransferase domain-containing protein [Nitrospirota bacterium]|nr:methyltransferase domain-containing protein [Nitrospirota bacterium]
MDDRPKYVPALGFAWLAPLYDTLIALVMQEKAFKRRLIDVADIQPNAAVLDLGCGTATLTLMIKQAHPSARVTGLDGDDRILNIARAKVKAQSAAIQLDKGLAFELPYPDGHFDRVLSSLVMHHLATRDKLRTFAEIHRVLKFDGQVHIADFGPPANLYCRLISRLLALLEPVEDNIEGRLPTMLQEAGFERVQTHDQFQTAFGTLALISAIKGPHSARELYRS